MASAPDIISIYKQTVLVLGLANIVVALLFLVWPNACIRLNKMLNLWVPTEKIEEALSRKRDIDPYLLKVRKPIGYVSIALAAALLFLYFKV